MHDGNNDNKKYNCAKFIGLRWGGRSDLGAFLSRSDSNVESDESLNRDLFVRRIIVVMEQYLLLRTNSISLG